MFILIWKLDFILILFKFNINYHFNSKILINLKMIEYAGFYTKIILNLLFNVNFTEQFYVVKWHTRSVHTWEPTSAQEPNSLLQAPAFRPAAPQPRPLRGVRSAGPKHRCPPKDPPSGNRSGGSAPRPPLLRRGPRRRSYCCYAEGPFQGLVGGSAPKPPRLRRASPSSITLPPPPSKADRAWLARSGGLARAFGPSPHSCQALSGLRGAAAGDLLRSLRTLRDADAIRHPPPFEIQWISTWLRQDRASVPPGSFAQSPLQAAYRAGKPARLARQLVASLGLKAGRLDKLAADYRSDVPRRRRTLLRSGTNVPPSARASSSRRMPSLRRYVRTSLLASRSHYALLA